MDRLILKEMDKSKDNRSPSAGLTEKELKLPTKRSTSDPISS